MDETDLSLFGKKNKHDKADASKSSAKDTTNFIDEAGIEPKLNSTIVSRATEHDTYDSYPNAGIALIFNHKDVKGQKQRTGTEKDRDAISKSLENYGFDVRIYNDLTFADINTELKAVANLDHSNNDCFILVVMSHGTEGKVYARDMSYPVERLWNPFLGNNCKSLVNKPKLFFIQACRGENLEKPVVYSEYAPMSRDLNNMGMETKPFVITYAIPNTADILVMYSTFDKYFSFRNVELGSWFIQSLCQILDAAAQNEASSSEGIELLRLLTAVNRRVAYEYQSNAKNEALNQMKEMPNFLSTLTKIFYLRVKRQITNTESSHH